MADSLTFMMGKFAAVLPADRRYCRNHMWAQADGAMLRFGFTSYAVRLMQDVYFLDWEVDAGQAVALKQKIGHIETSKAMSDLFAPMTGNLMRFNQDVLNDPSAINVDMYGAGWLFEMGEETAETLAVQEYYQFLEAGWEKTQNMLKGHM
jgi:glycine cleavage system H protein